MVCRFNTFFTLLVIFPKMKLIETILNNIATVRFDTFDTVTVITIF